MKSQPVAVPNAESLKEIMAPYIHVSSTTHGSSHASWISRVQIQQQQQLIWTASSFWIWIRRICSPPTILRTVLLKVQISAWNSSPSSLTVIMIPSSSRTRYGLGSSTHSTTSSAIPTRTALRPYHPSPPWYHPPSTP